jgi:hypothetical protein
MIASTAATYVEDLIEVEEFATLDVMSDFAVSTIKNVIRSFKATEKLLAQEFQAIKSQLQYTESRLRSIRQDYAFAKSLHEQETTRPDRTVKRIEECLQILSRTRICCNGKCEAELACYIERSVHLNEPKYLLRCAKCHYRHRAADS